MKPSLVLNFFQPVLMIIHTQSLIKQDKPLLLLGFLFSPKEIFLFAFS
jgi:hypothetical protein